MNLTSARSQRKQNRMTIRKLRLFPVKRDNQEQDWRMNLRGKTMQSIDTKTHQENPTKTRKEFFYV